MCKDARTRAHANQRHSSMGLYAVDQLATNAAAKRMPRDDLGILRLIQQGAT